MAAGIYPPMERPVEPTTNVGEQEMQESSISDFFTEREWMEIEYCRMYAEEYNHGTGGHLIRTVVAKLANLLEKHCSDEGVQNGG